jgi:hypothetical protein
MKNWPKAGSKATFKGTSKYFWFTNILKDADDLLEVGKEYTITKIELASSWCAVILQEFPEHRFALSWFTHDKDLTTQEAMKLEKESWETQKYEYTSLEELRDKKPIKIDQAVTWCASCQIFRDWFSVWEQSGKSVL